MAISYFRYWAALVAVVLLHAAAPAHGRAIVFDNGIFAVNPEDKVKIYHAAVKLGQFARTLQDDADYDVRIRLERIEGSILRNLSSHANSKRELILLLMDPLYKHLKRNQYNYKTHGPPLTPKSIRIRRESLELVKECIRELHHLLLGGLRRR